MTAGEFERTLPQDDRDFEAIFSTDVFGVCGSENFHKNIMFAAVHLANYCSRHGYQIEYKSEPFYKDFRHWSGCEPVSIENHRGNLFIVSFKK